MNTTNCRNTQRIVVKVWVDITLKFLWTDLTYVRTDVYESISRNRIKPIELY